MSELNDLSQSAVLKLNALLDRVKFDVFSNTDGGFLAPLMCNTEVIWDKTIDTAATNGINILWNPSMFLQLPHKTRRAVFLHELWHIARFDCLNLHLMSPLDSLVHNYATDIYINGVLLEQGETFEGIRIIHSSHYKGWSVLDTFNDLKKKAIANPAVLSQMHHSTPMASGINVGGILFDLKADTMANVDLSEDDVMQSLLAARNAAESAMGFSPSDMLADTLDAITQRLTPAINWAVVLRNYLIELGAEDYNWSIPDRRYPDEVFPSLQEEEEGKLTKILLFLDASGSIQVEQSTQFVSDVRYIKELFEPDEIHMIFFDTRIRDVQVFLKDDIIEDIKPVGGGGTSFADVRNYIIEHQPVAAVVFSDMECTPMEALPLDKMVDIIWIAMTRNEVTVPHGKVYPIRRLA